MIIKIYSSIEKLDPASWDRLVQPPQILNSYAYLKAVERAHFKDWQFLYVVVEEEGKIIAHAPACTIRFPLDLFGGKRSREIFARLRKFWPGFLTTAFLECGPPVAIGNTIAVEEGRDLRIVLPLLVVGLEQAARQRRMKTLLLRDFSPHQEEFRRTVVSLGFGAIPNLPNASMALSWKTKEAYLQSLKSKYRNEVRRLRSQAITAGITFEKCTHFSQFAAELLRLWHQTYEKPHEYRREILTESYFEEMDRQLGDLSGVILARLNEKIVGFALYTFDQNFEELTWHYSGMDYRVSRECSLYFNLIYELLFLGLERGAKKLHMGITTYFPKMQVGAEVEPLVMYMKTLNPLFHPVNLFLWKQFTKLPRLSPIEVFKKEPASTDPSLTKNHSNSL